MVNGGRNEAEIFSRGGGECTHVGRFVIRDKELGAQQNGGVLTFDVYLFLLSRLETLHDSMKIGRADDFERVELRRVFFDGCGSWTAGGGHTPGAVISISFEHQRDLRR